MSHKINPKKWIQILVAVFVCLFVLMYGRSTMQMQKQVHAVAESICKETEDEFGQEIVTKADVMNLRVNYMENPVGIDHDDIRFSWEPGAEQKAYEIIVFEDGAENKSEIVWDSGIVRSSETIQISYGGKMLEDGKKYEYIVFVFDKAGGLHYSETAYFQTAYISGQIFADADMISMNPEENIYENGQAVYYTTFELENKSLQKATFYGSALGMYDAYLNGHRIGEDELKPGWTDYNDTLLYNTYDITSYVQATNTIASMVGTGWWCGRNGFGTYGYNQPAFICQIVLEYEDGTTQIINTDKEWKYTKNTAVRFADFFNGETYDCSCLSTARISEGEIVPRADIRPVHISTHFTGKFKSYYGYNVKHMKESDRSPQQAYVYRETERNGTDFGSVRVISSFVRNPVDATDISLKKVNANGDVSEKEMYPFPLRKGETLIVDLGQNMTGVPYVQFDAPKGTQIHIQFAEMLNDSGEKERGNDGPKGSLYRANYRSATTEVIVISDGNGKQSYRPVFFYTGFRYLSLTADEDMMLYDLKGLFIGNSGPGAGYVASDSQQINRLWENVLWSQRNNYSLVATDCPQRDERLGWMGDLCSFAETSMYMQELYGFYDKWMSDVRDAQTVEGAYTDTVPATITTGSGNAGWAEAGILVPLAVYKKYGDICLLEEHYPSMQRYMEYLASISSYKPEDKRMGPLTTYGDWLSMQLSDSNMLSALWYQADALAMTETATLLGEREDAHRYRKLYEEINDYLMETYEYKLPWDRDGKEKNPEMIEWPLSQTEMLFLLRYSKLTEKQKQLIVADLLEDIEFHDYKVMTGFAGTPLLLPVLTEYGMSDVAYRILMCRDNPSWLYSVDQGATTIWERYDSYTIENGFADATMNSFNHFNEGSVAQWMHESMLGIQVNLARKEPITIEPVIPPEDVEITRVGGWYDSVYGKIFLQWEKRDDGGLRINLELPENVCARVKIPIEGMKEIVISGGKYEWNGNYKLLE